MPETSEQASRGTVRATDAPQPAGGDAKRPFRRILCAVDGTRPSFAAVAQAAQLAGPDGSLTLLAVTAPRGSGRFRSAAIGSVRAERAMHRAVEIVEQAGTPFTSVVDPGGPPAKVIEDRAREHDLLAIGAPSHSAFGSFGGSVAVQTLRTFSTPLLLARPAGGRRIDTAIVVASDGSEGSDALVELAARLAGPDCETIVLVHAQGRESAAHPHRVLAQKQALRDLCGERAHALIEPRDACELIEDAVEARNATLAVIGSRRIGGIGAVLGSVSHRAVRTLGCSVLVIPPEHLRPERDGE